MTRSPSLLRHLHADDDSFLADIKVTEAADEAHAVKLARAFFETADEQHFAIGLELFVTIERPPPPFDAFAAGFALVLRLETVACFFAEPFNPPYGFIGSWVVRTIEEISPQQCHKCMAHILAVSWLIVIDLFRLTGIRLICIIVENDDFVGTREVQLEDAPSRPACPCPWNHHFRSATCFLPCSRLFLSTASSSPWRCAGARTSLGRAQTVIAMDGMIAKVAEKCATVIGWMTKRPIFFFL